MRQGIWIAIRSLINLREFKSLQIPLLLIQVMLLGFPRILLDGSYSNHCCHGQLMSVVVLEIPVIDERDQKVAQSYLGSPG